VCNEGPSTVEVDECPAANSTEGSEEWIYSKYGEQICVMQSFNWMDDEINYLEDNVIQDISTLPSGITVNYFK
jgi:hypothetical protein